MNSLVGAVLVGGVLGGGEERRTRCTTPAQVSQMDTNMVLSWHRRIELAVRRMFRNCSTSGTVMNESARRKRTPAQCTDSDTHSDASDAQSDAADSGRI